MIDAQYRPRPDANLLDLVDDLVRDSGAEADVRAIDVRRHPTMFADVAIVVPDAKLRESAAGKALFERLEARPELEGLLWKGKKLSFRFTDETIAAAGAALERGERAALTDDGLLARRRFVVSYLHPNANKGLHVGHLRNLSIGDAAAGLLESAGGDVDPYCHVCDIGRCITEAMAGYTLFHQGEDPADTGQKGDHFVGLCYADYLRSAGASIESSAEDAPIARELARLSDLAQEYIERWMVQDPEVRELWERIIRWAVDGQKETLQRMGIRTARFLFESESMQRTPEFVERGLASGALERLEDGTIVYRADKEEYETMVLVRRDGFPTEHVRAELCEFVIAEALAKELDSYVLVTGDEWQPAVHVYRTLETKFLSQELLPKWKYIFHGMVELKGAKIKSSSGEALLIDEFIERLEASDAFRALQAGLEPAPTPDALAKLVVMAFYLSRSALKPIEFSWEQFMDERTSPGWLLARAWGARRRAPAGSDPDPADPEYRYAVLQAQRLRRVHFQSVESLDVSHPLRYLRPLAEWFDGSARTPRVARVVGAVADAALGMLALSPAGRRLEG